MNTSVKHTLVLDIGKTHAKLVLIDARGEVLARQVQTNESVDGPGYRALGTRGLENWLLDALPRLPERRHIGHIIVTTHGAAFCAIDENGLVLPPIDYEWDGYGEHRDAFRRQADPFELSGSPQLPMGLNAGLQLYWLQQTRPQDWRRIRHWLPYPQYWAWWFSGVASSEVSSLGCHTHLWQPASGDYAHWARESGLAALFAPMRRAWDALGPVRTELAARVGLPADCTVHVGVHDSNACLARHLQTAATGTVVSTGTWCVVMAPGAGTTPLDPARDQLINVSVLGQAVPTSRFMGGREFAILCAGVDPSLATEAALSEVRAQGWSATPAFAESGGPFQGSRGRVLQHGVTVPHGITGVPMHLRPALASLYCAEITALLVQTLNGPNRHETPVVLEGPLAQNQAFVLSLAALLRKHSLMRSTDPLEGTARGAWLLANWESRSTAQSWYETIGVPAPAATAAPPPRP
jgi:sugar (pentulose or hexulose) kinase